MFGGRYIIIGKELIMTIRFIGGMWRRIEGDDVRSFITYQEAVDNKKSWEDLSPQTTSDDIANQMNK
jgi:hypothetical protein